MAKRPSNTRPASTRVFSSSPSTREQAFFTVRLGWCRVGARREGNATSDEVQRQFKRAMHWAAVGEKLKNAESSKRRCKRARRRQRPSSESDAGVSGSWRGSGDDEASVPSKRKAWTPPVSDDKAEPLSDENDD